jgi:uncharacterized protein YecE (DUF72 family)
MTTPQGTIRIGTSGWTYGHWRGVFFPDDLADDDRLRYYAARFDSVEINNSFYQLPSATTLARWRDSVAPEFRFALKASRYITHMKKLKDPSDSIATLLERAGVLGDRVGPILFQLPPRWRFDAQRLADFLDALSDDFRYAFEFRDHSWLDDRSYDLLAAHGAALCIYDLAGFRSPRAITAPFTYVRLHGPAGPYEGSYDAQALSGWAGAFSAWSRQGHDVYCYFDNDQAGNAVANATRLQRMLTRA